MRIRTALYRAPYPLERMTSFSWSFFIFNICASVGVAILSDNLRLPGTAEPNTQQRMSAMGHASIHENRGQIRVQFELLKGSFTKAGIVVPHNADDDIDTRERAVCG